MSKKRFVYEYPRPAVTVDVAIVSRSEPQRILLIRRKQPPFEGTWALPGGFVDMDEDLEVAARRELYEETGVRAARLKQLATFGKPGRDPRGRTISVVYLALVDEKDIQPRAADDAAEVGWHSLNRPPQLAFDHREILAAVRERLRER